MVEGLGNRPGCRVVVDQCRGLQAHFTGRSCRAAQKKTRTGTDQGFSSSNEHLESNTTRVFFIVSFPRIDSKPSPSLSRSSKTRCDSRSP